MSSNFEKPEIIYGRNPVNEALSGIRRVRKIFFSKTVGDSPLVKTIINEAKRLAITVEGVDPARVESMAPSATHQGVLAEVDPYPYRDLNDLLKPNGEPPLILILDRIQDPQNLGSLLRSAEVAGASGIVIPKVHSAEVTSAVCKASAGATEHVSIARMNISEALRKLKERDVWIYGASAEGETDYFQADFTLPSAIVIGSEGEGLRRLTEKQCDFLIKIPLSGKIDSLNAAISGAIILFEARKQRRLGGK